VLHSEATALSAESRSDAGAAFFAQRVELWLGCGCVAAVLRLFRDGIATTPKSSALGFEAGYALCL